MKSIFKKIFSGYLIIITILIGVILYITFNLIHDDYVKTIVNNLLNLNHTIDLDITHFLKDNKISELDSNVKIIGNETNVRITIINTKGIVLADSKANPKTMENHSDRPEIINAIKIGVGQSIRHSYTVNKNMMYVAVPIKYKNEIIGVSRLSYYMDDVDNLINSLIYKILLIVFIIVVLSLIIAFILSKNLTKPIKKLVQFSFSVAKGNFNDRIQISTKDELRTLGESYNNMVDKLQYLFNQTNLQKEELQILLDDLQENKVIIEENLYQRNLLVQELSESELKLKENVDAKDKFFSIIAHDLKAPFNGFLGLTKIMAEQFQDLSMREVQEMSKNLQESAKELYKLLENLLEWARMQRGVIDFNPEQCSLKQIVTHNLSIVGEFSKQKNIEIIDRIPENFQINVDVPMINTVFRNLISNAIKFTPNGGKIEIGVTEIPSEGLEPSEGSKMKETIYIKDSGIGMSPEILEKLFKIDQKVSRPGTAGESSTGLGLLLCKEFVEKNGGRIWVESEVGKGSTFFFTLN